MRKRESGFKRRREAAPERKNYKNNKRAGGPGGWKLFQPPFFLYFICNPFHSYHILLFKTIDKRRGWLCGAGVGEGGGLKCRVSNHAEPLVVVSRCVSSPMVSLLCVGVNTIYKYSAQHLSIKVSFKANFILQKSFF